MATLRDIAQGRSIPLVTRAMVATTVALSLVAIVAQLYQKPVPIGSGREPHSMSSPALGSIPDSGERRDPRLSPTETVVSYLVLYPGLLLTRPWTLLLAHWVETNIVLLIGHAAILAGAGMYLEPRWHWLEFLKFVGGVAVAASGATFLCLLAAYAGSRRITYLYDTSIHGLFGVVAGLTVAFKQAIPEHRVVLGNRSWLAFRVNYLTSLYVPFTVAILCLLGLYSYACLVVFGTIAAWVYLRFVKMYNGTRGDLSDAFAFATFFPDPVQPPIRWVCEHIFRFMVWCHVLRPMPAYNPYSVENGVLPTPPPSVLGDEQSEAERRRALAMKAVDLRITANESAPNHATL